MMRRFSLTAFLAVVSFLTTVITTQAQSWAWATNPGAGSCYTTATDGAGNLYVGGYFSDTVTFGSTRLISVGSNDWYVAKYSAAGTCLWATRAGSAADDRVNRLVLDAAGNVYVIGRANADTQFPGTTIQFAPTTTPYPLVVAALSPAGAWQWAELLTNVTGVGLAVDGGGNLYVGGWLMGPTQLGSIPLSGGAGEDIWVAKRAAGGTWQWATAAGGNSVDRLQDLVVDSSGSVYAVGVCAAPATFGSLTVSTSGGFVARLTPAGTWQWVTLPQPASANSGCGVSTVALDHHGHVNVAGTFSGFAVDFGATRLTTSGSGDVYVAQLSTAGAWQWATSGQGTDAENAIQLRVDPHDHLYLCGVFTSSSLTFGTTTLLNQGTRLSDVYVASLSPTGTWQWATSAGGTNQDFVIDLALDSSGSVYVGGYSYSDPLWFGPQPLPLIGLPAMFFARLTPPVLGLSEAETAAPFHLAPNPAHGTVRLSNLPPGATTAHIIDALGRTVQTSDLELLTSDLSLHGLPPGLYVVRVGSVSRRLVVE